LFYKVCRKVFKTVKNVRGTVVLKRIREGRGMLNRKTTINGFQRIFFKPAKWRLELPSETGGGGAKPFNDLRV